MSFDLILPFFPSQIQDLLLDEHISDLCINGDSNVFVERDGLMSMVQGLRMQRDHIKAVVEQIARILGRDITEKDRTGSAEPSTNTRKDQNRRTQPVSCGNDGRWKAWKTNNRQCQEFCVNASLFGR